MPNISGRRNVSHYILAPRSRVHLRVPDALLRERNNGGGSVGRPGHVGSSFGRRSSRNTVVIARDGNRRGRGVAGCCSGVSNAPAAAQRYGPRYRSSNKAATLRRRSSQLGAPRELVRTHRAMRSHHRPRASSATSSVPLGSVYPISATVKGPLCHGGSLLLPPVDPSLGCRNRSKWC